MDKAVYQAMVRGLQTAADLLTAEGGCILGWRLGDLLDVTEFQLGKCRKCHELLGVRLYQDGEWHYPLWQFERGWNLLPGFKQVLAALPQHDPWAAMIFFLRTETVSGETPLQVLKLKAGRLDEVLLAARQYGEQGAV